MHKTIGHRLPELRLEGLTGSDRSIYSGDLAGSVVLINFWGTWCGPCLIELPHLAELGRKYSTREDFQLLAVSAGPSESADDLENLRRDTLAFLKQSGTDIPTYADPGNATFDGFCEMARRLDPSAMEGVPTTILLDRRGIIRGVWIGYVPGLENEMEEMVKRLLDEEGK
jgi:thiol-disulfide isomerase/thioredoxin